MALKNYELRIMNYEFYKKIPYSAFLRAFRRSLGQSFRIGRHFFAARKGIFSSLGKFYRAVSPPSTVSPYAFLDCKKVLIRTPNWLGDSVMSIPAVKGMKKIFPQAELWVYTKSNLADLWKLVPEVKGVLAMESFHGERFDLALLLTNSFKSALQIYLARIPQRRGYRINARGLLLTQKVPVKKEMHQIDYFLELINGLGEVDTTSPKIDISEGLQQKTKKILGGIGWRDGEPIIAIHATAKYGPAKCWMPERFSLLIQELKKIYKPWILICGNHDEKAEVENILRRLPDREKIVNITGQTGIKELASFISLCKVFIANDSGPMHLASALGRPVVAIFGSTDPCRTGPRALARGGAVIIRKHISCSPCFRRICPKDLECMRMIEVKDVMQAVREMF